MSQYGARGMAQSGKNANQILEHYYNPAKVTQETRYATSDIRVQVLRTDSVSMSVAGGQARITDGTTTRTATSTLGYTVQDDKLSYTVDGKTYTTTSKLTLEWEGTRAWASSRKAIVSVQRANDGRGTVGYRHGFMSIGVLAGKVNVVNQLRLNDEYLYGLAEVPSSWESAALQAQAIAGRTYAMRNMTSVKSSCDCNVYDEVASQKFTAWNKENESFGLLGARWKAAVEATLTRRSGVITQAKAVRYNGALIDAVYSSSTGGKTRAARNVWGHEHAYLQSRDDSWALLPSVRNPNASWTRSITQAQARTGFGLSDVVDIELAKSADLSIASATATSKTGKKSTLSGSRFRALIGAKAAWIRTATPVGGVKKETIEPSSSETVRIEQVAKSVEYQTTTSLNLRDAPINGKVVTVLKKNAAVKSTGQGAHNGSWIQVAQGTRKGWVAKKYLKNVVKPAAPKPAEPRPVAPKPATPKPATPTPQKTTSKKVTTHTTTTNLNLRSTAGKGRVLAVMKKGSRVTLTGKSTQKGKWVQVKYGSKTGWASKSYIKTTTQTTTTASDKSTTQSTPVAQSKSKAKTRTTTTRLNLRSGAGTRYKVLTVLPKGKKVTEVAGSRNGWTKIKYGSTAGYSSSKYLK